MPQCSRNAWATLISRHGSRASAVQPRQVSALGAGRRLAGAQQAEAIGDQLAPRGAGPVPFEHREFGMVGRAALAVAKHMGQLPDPRQARDQQLFHREFRRGVEIARQCPAIARVVQLGGKGPQMRFETGAHLQRRGIDLDKALRRKKTAHRSEHPATLLQPPAPPGKSLRPPPILHSLGAPACREAAPC